METITRSTASMSWIDPQTGIPEVDEGGHPGATTTRVTVLGEKVYRFSNFLEAEILIEENAVKEARFTSVSGMYRSPSFAHLPSAPVGNIGRTFSVMSILKTAIGYHSRAPNGVELTEQRHSGRDCRNLEAKDGKPELHPCILDVGTSWRQE